MYLPGVNDKLKPRANAQRPPEHGKIRGVRGVGLSDINGNTPHLPYIPSAPDGSGPGSGGTALSRANRNNTGLFAPELPRSATSAVPSNAMSRHNKTVAKNQAQPVLNVPQVLHILDCNRDDKVPRKDFKREISWKIEGGPVENLELRVTRISSVDGGEKVDRYPIANEAANSVPPVSIEIDHWQAISLLLVGAGCAPSIPLEIPIDDSVPLHSRGGPLRNLLNHHHIVKNAKETTMQEVDDELAVLDQKYLQIKACQLLNKAADYFRLDDKLLEGTGFEKSKLRDRSEVVLDVIKDVPLPKALLDQITKILPVVSVVKAGGSAAVSLFHAGSGALKARKMVLIQTEVVKVNKYFERPTTAMTVLGRFEDYHRFKAINALSKFVTSFLEAACRLTLGFGTVVAVGFTIQSFVRYVIERYINERLVEITNLKLEICQKTGNPEAYYDVIENGHICVATHIVANYSDHRLTATDLVYHPFDKVVEKLRKGGPELKKEAKTINDAERYHVAPLTGDYTGRGRDSSPAADSS
jgi:hypothetical protein